MSDLRRYFDYNATTPLAPAAGEAWARESAEHWHNPSSLYREAGAARTRLEDLREELAERLGVEEPGRVVFTSGATEANNAVLRHFAAAGLSVAVSAVEHPSVQAAAASFLPRGALREIPVDPAGGVVDLAILEGWVKSGEVGAVSVMAANNETGTLQPWERIAALCREHGAAFHCDAAQWIGKLSGAGLGVCDYLTGSAHKFGGPKGAGFLVLPEEGGGDFLPSLTGGPQEEGRRAGTENLPAAAALVAALSQREDASLADLAGRLARHRDRFEVRIAEEIGCRPLGAIAPRLWNTSMFTVPHGKNLKWLVRLSSRGFCVSTGSACSAGRGNPSRVMAAMGLDFETMGRVVRVSGGWGTDAADWDELASALCEIGRELREGKTR